YNQKQYRFYDNETDFQLSFAGFRAVDDAKAVFEDAAAKEGCDKALALMARMEAGEVINHTAVKAESEDRQVDHYNLRLKEEKVTGKSLAHSLTMWEEVKAVIERIENGDITNEAGERFTDVVFNGIGGSFLGPLMLIISQKGDEYNTAPDMKVKVHFVANTDPETFDRLVSRNNLKNMLMVVMSKSGGTSETLGNWDTFSQEVSALGLAPNRHLMAITIPGSFLDGRSKSEKWVHTFNMHEETGGRTSIWSAIGAVPCAFAHIDFAEFLKGASHMDEMTRRADAPSNPAMLMSLYINHLLNKSPKNMMVLGYSDCLKEYSHYLQQLYMESLGKEYDIEGKAAPHGLTVFGGVGTGEQHSCMQQIQKGINDTFVRFIHFRHREADYANAKAGSMGRQLLAFVKGTELALNQNGRSFVTMTFSKPNPFNMGMMVALEERVVSILAAFWDINAYDQPGVQDGKLAAKGVNALSLAIENALVAAKAFTALSVTDTLSTLGVEAASLGDNLEWLADSLLSDICANGGVQNAYKLSAKMSREWDAESCQFKYTWAGM
ncbi:phosphoglucose isomerase, partial [Kipferlia bialata]